MTMVVPEGNYNFREDTVLENKPILTTTDIVILGEDILSDNTFVEYSPDEKDAHFIGPKFLSLHDAEFVGPHDATNFERALLLRRAGMLAEVAVVNFGAYESERAGLARLTKQSALEGTLRLNDEYKDMSIDQQVDHFVADAVKKSVRDREAVFAELEARRTVLNLQSNGPEHALQIKVNELTDSVRKQSSRILRVRGMLVEKGATEEFMHEYDYTMKLMTAPDLEAYEHEMQLDPEHETPALVDTGAITIFDKFKAVLGPSFGKKALRSIGILPPISGQVQVIHQNELT